MNKWTRLGAYLGAAAAALAALAGFINFSREGALPSDFRLLSLLGSLATACFYGALTSLLFGLTLGVGARPGPPP